MLKIGICDKDEGYIEQLHNLLVKFFFSKMDIDIRHYGSGDEIVAEIEDREFSVDLLFIDICRDSVNGLETARFIRKHCINVDLIFLSDEKTGMPEGYNYHVLAWYKKPVKAELINSDMSIYIKERSKDTENFSISTKGKDIHIPLNRIIYFKSEKRKIIAHTLTADVTFYAKMDDVEELVSDKFFIRCHQSYIVNRDMIDVVRRQEIIAQGIHIPVSRKYYEKIELLEEVGIIRITRGEGMHRPKYGMLIFAKGDLEGVVIRIRSDKEIRIGRDKSLVDIVLHNKRISRLHCGIIYNCEDGIYTINDYSKNGIETSGGDRTKLNQSIEMPAGEEICLGKSENVIRLG